MAGATLIDGSGKYLIPGLTDAHVHFFQSGGIYTRPDGLDLQKFKPYEQEIKWVHDNMEDFLRRYLQQGITSVVDVGATYHFLKQREKFVDKNFAPTIYMSGPLLTSEEPAVFKNLKSDEPFKLFHSIAEARKMVQEQLPYHPDFIKIWYIVNPDSVAESAKKYLPIVKAIIEESHKNHLKVAIHATERITAQLAVENGCDYLVHSVEDQIIPKDFIQLLKTKHVVICPTMIVAKGYDLTMGQNWKYGTYELRYANPIQVGSLEDAKHISDTAYLNKLKKWMNSSSYQSYTKQTDSIRRVNLKNLANAGVTIVAGTDAGNIGTQHATSLLPELKAMKAAGLTNWQILQSATVANSKLFNKNMGEIKIGNMANLVLLNASPIDNLDNLTQISFVVNKGHLIRPDTLIKETPLALVQRQLNGYNAKNIDAFLEPYAEDVEIYDFPNQLIFKGKLAMQKDYEGMFKTLPNLHCELKNRIIQGNIIIDQESVSGMGDTKLEATAIYHIEKNKIKKVYFIQ